MRTASIALVVTAALGCQKRPEPDRVPEVREPKAHEPKAGSKTDVGPDPDPTPQAGRFEDGFFRADAAPPPLACSSAKDCTASVPLDASGCCREPKRLTAVSWAYHSWASKWRQENCDSHECPPLPNPPPPEDCQMEVDCVDGQCLNGCLPGLVVARVGIDAVDRLRTLLHLGRAGLLAELGASEADVKSGSSYGQLEGLDKLADPERWPATYYLRNKSVVVIYTADEALLAKTTAAALKKALGKEPDVTLRARTGKRSKKAVYADVGIAVAYSDEAKPVELLEVFSPTDPATYQSGIHHDVGPYVR